MAMNRIFRCFLDRSLTLAFEQFPFWLWIRGDIRNKYRFPDSVSRGVADSPYRWVGESAIEFLKEVHVVPEEPEKWKAAASISRIIQVSIGPLN